MKLAVAVVATPKRLPTIPARISQRLACPCYVIVDRDMRGMWFNYRRCMLWDYPQDVTHVLILEDDVEVCADLAETAEHLAGLHPGQMINLFNYSREMFERCQVAGAPFWRTHTSFTTQAILFPRETLRPIVRWIDEHIHPNGFVPVADMRLGIYNQIKDQWVITVAHSLVYHDKGGESQFGSPAFWRPETFGYIGNDGRGMSRRWDYAGPIPTHRGRDAVKRATLNLKGVVPWEHYYDHKPWNGVSDLNINGLPPERNA